MTPTKQAMLDSLPVRDGDLIIRARTRGDIDEYAKWPQYPKAFEAFNKVFSLRFAAMTQQERDEQFGAWAEDGGRITLCVDKANEKAVASLTLREIDWDSRKIGNMGFLVNPAHVDKGLGTRIMLAVKDWCFGHGIVSLRFDVVACNFRAVRCYEKAGFSIVGEFWKDEEPLRGKDLTLPEYDSMRPHVRIDEGSPQIRFWWMELRRQAGGEVSR